MRPLHRVYTSAFRSSDCCGARLERHCSLGLPDLFICCGCRRACKPVADDR